MTTDLVSLKEQLCPLCQKAAPECRCSYEAFEEAVRAAHAERDRNGEREDVLYQDVMTWIECGGGAVDGEHFRSARALGICTAMERLQRAAIEALERERDELLHENEVLSAEASYAGELKASRERAMSYAEQLEKAMRVVRTRVENDLGRLITLDVIDAALSAAPGATDTRSCTCHPDDNPPVPCPRKYALSECRKAAGKEGGNSAVGDSPALALLRRIRQWDMLDACHDGLYWKGEIDAAIQHEAVLRAQVNVEGNGR